MTALIQSNKGSVAVLGLGLVLLLGLGLGLGDCSKSGQEVGRRVCHHVVMAVFSGGCVAS